MTNASTIGDTSEKSYDLGAVTVGSVGRVGSVVVAPVDVVAVVALALGASLVVVTVVLVAVSVPVDDGSTTLSSPAHDAA
ncbi:MAG: hypothetical protein WBL31_07710, partial [Ilumatobacteraceae bacterium]